MRWLGLVLCVGCATAPPALIASPWERLCYDAPYRRITPQLTTWLRQEGVVEQRGWIITPEWLNAQCDTVPGRHRR